VSDQQRVREAFRKMLPEFLDAAVEEAAIIGQARLAADAIAADLMAGPYDGEKFAEFVQSNRDFLGRKSAPVDWKEELIEALAKATEAKLVASSPPPTKYHSGMPLRRMIANHIEYDMDSVNRAFDSLCESRDSDWFPSNDAVRHETLTRFANLVRLECIQDVTTPASDERPLKARLKALTVLIDNGIPHTRRLMTLRALTDPSTRALPYVARYLFPGQAPALAALPAEDKLELGGFSDDLVRCGPEASMARDAAERFDRKEGLFGDFADVDAPTPAQHAGQFAKLPGFVPDATSPLLVPKGEAVPRHRANRYRIPDGIVAALGLSIVLEWTLRQGTMAADAGAHQKPRAADLVKRLLEKGAISQGTADLLKPVFDSPALSLRDAVAHGAFFGDDPLLIHRGVAAMSRALKLLVDDLARTAPRAFAVERWDKGASLDPKHTALAGDQLKTGLVVFDQIGEAERQHLFGVLREITPDKRFLGQASFVFFAKSYRSVASRKEHARPELFASCLGSLVTLEDLFRAVLEREGKRVLRVEADAHGVVKCQLAILDVSPGNLLDPSALTTVLGANATTMVAEAFAAARSFRDGLMHGRLSLLSSGAFAFSHLLMKLLFVLSGSVRL
jgi:hypothetical protein